MLRPATRFALPLAGLALLAPHAAANPWSQPQDVLEYKESWGFLVGALVGVLVFAFGSRRRNDRITLLLGLRVVAAYVGFLLVTYGLLTFVEGRIEAPPWSERRYVSDGALGAIYVPGSGAYRHVSAAMMAIGLVLLGLAVAPGLRRRSAERRERAAHAATRDRADG